MIAPAMDPARQRHFLACVGGSQFATVMSLVHDAPPNSFLPRRTRRALRWQGLLNVMAVERNSLCSVVPVVFDSRQNKSPFACALGDWFPFRTYLLTSKASPNDRGIIVIIIIIVIDEAKMVFHVGGIIAQRFHLDGPFLFRE
jgi:hypothetical protein